MSAKERLINLLRENNEAGQTMETLRPRFDRIRNAEKGRIVTGFNLFQTPKELASRMASMLPSLKDDAVILEPSAGLGRLYSAVRDTGFSGKIILVENNPDCMRELYDKSRGDNVELIQRDFTGTVKLMYCDAAIMNPPFKKGLDIKHIKHAYKIMRKGGVLVALCYNGVKQNKHLKPLCDTWEVLPQKTFKESGTNASVVLLTMKKQVTND